MEKALFKGWTENQLRTAFRSASVMTLKAALRDPEFWRVAAYIAALTGGEPPQPTP